jgi:phage baseplate assembly protein W
MSQEHIENILLITKGSLRMKPLVGVNLIDYVNAPWSLKNQVKLDKSIRVQLTLDGYSIKRIITNDLSNIIIDAIK